MKKSLLISALFLTHCTIAACSSSASGPKTPQAPTISEMTELVERIGQEKCNQCANKYAAIHQDYLKCVEKENNITAEAQKTAFTPIDVKMPAEEIEKWVKAAVNGDETGMFILAMMYRINQTHPLDDSSSQAFDLEPFKNIIIEKEYEFPEGHNSFHELLRWVIRLEDESSIFADLIKSPALIYQKPVSLSCPEDNCEAAWAWLEEAAKRGYADAEYMLAIIYLNGIAVPVDKERGTQMMRRAAVHGLNVAQYDLAMMYKLGVHMPEQQSGESWLAIDYGEGQLWLETAADTGHESAKLISLLQKLDSSTQNPQPLYLLQSIEDMTPDMKEMLRFALSPSLNHPWPYLLISGDFQETCTYEFDHSYIYSTSIYDAHDWNSETLSKDKSNAYQYSCAETVYVAEDILLSTDDDYEYDLVSCQEELDDGYNPDDYPANPERDAAYEEKRQIDAREMYSLPYGIDYELDNLWLSDAAQNESNTHARYLWALTLADKGCHGSDSDGDALDTARQIIENDFDEENIELKHLLLANINYHALDNYREAFDLYQKSMSEGSADAQDALYRIMLLEDKKKILTKLDIKDPYIYAYQWLTDEIDGPCGMAGAAANAERIINESFSAPALTRNNTESALKWYYRNIESLSGLKSSITNFKPFSKLVNKTFTLISQNEGKLPHIQTDKAFMDEWSRRVVELRTTDEKNYALAKKRLSKLQILDGFDDAIMNQIQTENSQKLNFFVKNKIKTPYIKGDLNRQQLDDYYFESIQKAQVSIVAILLAQNISPNPEIIQNTFYHLAIELPRDEDFMNRCEAESQFCQDIRHSELGLDTEDLFVPFYEQSIYRRELFFIWYLRQFPYAAEEMYRSLESTIPWKTHVKEARKLIKSNQEIASAINYDPRLPMQKLPAVDFSQIPDMPTR